MDFLTWGRNPWGQQILTHVSWDLLWASLFAGVMFLVAHASYMVLSAHRKRSAAETDALEAAHKNLPERIERHSFMARMFHWVMAASMFVLLFTAFLPIVGVQVRLGHVALDGGARADRLDHLPHHPRHLLARLLVDLGRSEGHPRVQGRDAARARPRRARVRSPGKYPLGNRLYHLAIVVVGLAAVDHRHPDDAAHPHAALRRAIRTCMSDATWGFTYVLHGLAGVGLVGLVIAHVYFAVRPEKWWITKGMIFGWITRRQYLEHHDPKRWKVSGGKAQPASRA